MFGNESTLALDAAGRYFESMKTVPNRVLLQRSALDPALVACSLACGLSVLNRLTGPKLLRRSPRRWWGPRKPEFTLRPSTCSLFRRA